MIGVKFQTLVSTLLISIEFVIATKSDGFCTVLETYIDPSHTVDKYTETVRVTKSCGFLLKFVRTCYENKFVERTLPASPKSRIKKRCCQGYTLKDNNCVPVCVVKCMNAQCTGPNTCTCDPGYEESRLFHSCNPKCKEGYKFDVQSMACEPVCSKPCSNGKCFEPEICKCFSGYHKNTAGICIENECDALTNLSNECLNGTCTSNGVCLCNESFVKNDTSLECTPICDACNNGICVPPNKCLCSDGFEWNFPLSRCLPKCSDGCLNGNCVLPEECACNSGYEVFNSSMCSPICEEPCLYGTCTEPNKCICFEGYQLQNDSYHMCNPVCSSGCLNGNCVKPDLCLCDDGFEFSEESKICEPVCDIECVNSNCTSPNICTCEMGFTPSNSTHCEILCENCTHGYCEEPNVCQCDIAYYLNNNGQCVENECSTDKAETICENGYCLDGFCVCDSGFKKNASRACAPVCSLECVNGYCYEPEVCRCYTGYELKTKNGNYNGNNCTNCTILTNLQNICYPKCSSTSKEKCIFADGLSIRSAQENQNVSSVYVWIIVAAIVVITLIALYISVYVRYFKRISYRCSSASKVIYYENESDAET